MAFFMCAALLSQVAARRAAGVGGLVGRRDRLETLGVVASISVAMAAATAT